jgi:long-chain acyl-CoA synthetase
VQGPNIAQMLRTNAARHADRPMFRFENQTVTWELHYKRSCRVAHALASEGLGPGSRVAFLDRNGLAYFEVLFGSALIGAVNVAVNWRLSPPEMAAVIDDSKASVLVVHSELLGCLTGMKSGLPYVTRIVVVGELKARVNEGGASDLARRVAYEDWIAPRPDTDPGYVARSEEVSMQLYTSGTTGLPKGVMLTNANIGQLLLGATETFGISDSTVSLVAMPLFHIGGSGWALGGMSGGGTSVILRDMVPAELLRLVETERVTHAFVVPAVLMMLLATPETDTTDFSSLDTVFYGASPISEDVLLRCLKVFGSRFSQLYGMTETSGAIVRLDPEDHEPDGPRRNLLRSAGRALPGVELRVVDPATRDDVPPGVVGEVCTRSAYNMTGYWEKKQETEETIVEGGWLRTGDAGYIDEDGYLFLYDRIKDLVISGGENIYPAEVENVLLSHPKIVDAAVFGIPDETWGEAVKAVVVRIPDGDIAEEELIAHCRANLAHYKCPKSVEFAEALPRNPSGKILKRELREPFWKGQERRVH